MAELEAKLKVYRSAVAQLVEARAIAQSIWPDPAPGIMVTASNRRIRNEPGRYQGCYAEEVDPEGNQWPEIACGGGRGSLLPRYIALSSMLRNFLDDVRGEPAEWEDGVDVELAERVKEAERYEDGCYEAF